MHESVHVLPPATAITLKQGPTSTSSSLITKAMESKAHQRYSVVVCHIVSTNFNLTGSPTVSRTHCGLILETESLLLSNPSSEQKSWNMAGRDCSAVSTCLDGSVARDARELIGVPRTTSLIQRINHELDHPI